MTVSSAPHGNVSRVGTRGGRGYAVTQLVDGAAVIPETESRDAASTAPAHGQRSRPRSHVNRADTNVVTLHVNSFDPGPAPAMDPSSQAASMYGVAELTLQRAWTASDVQSYLGIGRTQVYALMRDPSAPPRLRTGRSHRWNALQVLAWLHHDDWRHPMPAQTQRPASEGTAESDVIEVGRATGTDGSPTAPRLLRSDTPTAPDRPLTAVEKDPADLGVTRGEERQNASPRQAGQRSEVQADDAGLPHNVVGPVADVGATATTPRVRTVDPVEVNRARNRARVGQLTAARRTS